MKPVMYDMYANGRPVALGLVSDAVVAAANAELRKSKKKLVQNLDDALKPLQSRGFSAVPFDMPKQVVSRALNDDGVVVTVLKSYGPRKSETNYRTRAMRRVV